MIYANRQQHSASGCRGLRALDQLRDLPIIPAFMLSLLLACMTLAACDESEPSGPMPQDDTTSHNFEWYIDTLGAELSRVNDVYCISENDAWAVGYFYYSDPETGQRDRTRNANAAHWDGEKWTMHRINPTYDNHQTFAELLAVHAFPSNNIWVNERHWNGDRWVAYDLNNISSGATRKIWGERPDNVYFVGYDGSLTRWNGMAFAQLDGGTTAAYCDVWGWKDTMYVAVSDYELQSGRRGYLLRYEGGVFQRREIFDFNEQIAVWGMNGTWYSGGCSPLYRKTGGEWKRALAPADCITGIRGTSLNNVYIFLTRGSILHYNGSTFTAILDKEQSGNFYTHTVSVAGDMVLACGLLNGHAIIKRGYQKAKE